MSPSSGSHILSVVDVSICTVLSLHDLDVVTLVSSSNDSLSDVDESALAVVCLTSVAMEIDAYWVLASTEDSMPESKTADDACTCTELSLEDSGVVAFVSSSDVFFSCR